MQSKSVKYKEQLSKLEADKLKYEKCLSDVNKKIKETKSKLNVAINEEKLLLFQRLIEESPITIEELESLFNKKDELLKYMKKLTENDNGSEKLSNNDKYIVDSET